MKHVKDWLYSAAGKISISIIIISILIIVLAWSPVASEIWAERNASLANSILVGIATNLIGIVVMVSFVQYFLDKQDEKEDRRDEIKKIKRYDRYMQSLIKRYNMFYMSLTTRLKDRSVHGAEDPFDHSFKFSDMADLYKSSLYVGEGFRESSIELFYQAEENLRNYMLKMLENIDFKYNFEFEELLQEFVTKSAGLDMRGQILGLIQTSMGGNNKATEQISEWISDETEDWLGKYQRRELTGNLMLPYVILYYSIQDQMRMIKEYKRLIEKLAC